LLSELIKAEGYPLVTKEEHPYSPYRYSSLLKLFSEIYEFALLNIGDFDGYTFYKLLYKMVFIE